MASIDMGHFIYKYVFDKEVIYIGKNNTNLIDRIKQHKNSSDKLSNYLDAEIFYFKLDSSLECDIVETILINKYRPKLNIAKKLQKLEIEYADEERWIKFNEEDFITPKKENKNSSASKSLNAKKAWCNIRIRKIKYNILNYQGWIFLFKYILECFMKGKYMLEAVESDNKLKVMKCQINDTKLIKIIHDNLKSFDTFCNNITLSIKGYKDIAYVNIYFDDCHISFEDVAKNIISEYRQKIESCEEKIKLEHVKLKNIITHQGGK